MCLAGHVLAGFCAASLITSKRASISTGTPAPYHRHVTDFVVAHAGQQLVERAHLSRR
jgi:hypothetical protein